MQRKLQKKRQHLAQNSRRKIKSQSMRLFFLGVVALIALAAGGGFYVFTKQKQKKQAEKEALDPDADYTEDNGNFEIPRKMIPMRTLPRNRT